MNYLSYFYLFLYYFNSYHGYNWLHRYMNNKKLDTSVIFYPASFKFLPKRLFQLSNLTFLYTVYFIEYPDEYRFNNILLLNTVVNIGYNILSGFNEPITSFLHVYWCLPSLKYGYIYFQPYALNNENIYLLFSLILYIPFINKIYTKRIPIVDD